MEVAIVFLLIFVGAYVILGTYLLSNAIGLTEAFRTAQGRNGASQARKPHRTHTLLRNIVVKDDE